MVGQKEGSTCKRCTDTKEEEARTDGLVEQVAEDMDFRDTVLVKMLQWYVRKHPEEFN